VTGRRQAELDAAVAAIGPRATGVEGDSADLSDLNRLYERVKMDAGRIDVLLVNAGGGSMLPLGSITEEQYDDTFGRNVKGVLFTVHPHFVCTPHSKPQALHNAGRLAWGSGPRGESPDYTGWDVIIVHDGKIAALYVFLDSMPS
jgi:NAD(P)-dependent dehydrogenase (short-subunit alcohol dehydrogenase family)